MMRRIAVVACGVGTLAVAGCGGGGARQSRDRPPPVIGVSAYVSDTAVSVSPAHLGGGPVNLTVTNQSTRTQRLSVATDGSAAAPTQTGPIRPGGIATLNVDLPSGQTTVRADGGSVTPFRLTVGRRRPSAQNELLQP